MSNPIKLLTRLFSRNSANAVVTEIYAKAVNQPLFVHPALGEMIVQGYLHADVNQLAGDAGQRGMDKTEATVGILDISGALVSRYTPGPCSAGPLSYEEIRDNFDAMMADPGIKTIIGRFDTPGGMAAQNMDLTDHIYQARGQGKRLIAMVDDMAYSAGFALASAFDEIWITRTSGVGSVGVVSYHIDQSDFNNKLGVKIEYLHAGARKIDGNPHEPLGDEARANFMGEISRLYDLFASTVARNLGLSVEAVKATEAGTFHGERAVEAGFAHKIGTFSDLLQSLIPQGHDHVVTVTMEDQGGMTPQQEQSGLSEPEQPEDHALDDGEEESQGGESSQPAASSKTYKEKLEDQKKRRDPDGIEVDSKAKIAAEIRAICAAAKVPEAAANYITAGTDVEQVRADLFAMLTAGEIEISNALPAKLVETAQQTAQPSAGSIYRKRQQHFKR
ncbi:S49 family peptidase [Methylobacter marinus]|uniref:S49 family peptidase n=1 Tax=Methylobacter marinus TaxID=34058 RepID=UPI00036E27B7|nr:S49 family peptidase [Methylobacter marinus]